MSLPMTLPRSAHRPDRGADPATVRLWALLGNVLGNDINYVARDRAPQSAAHQSPTAAPVIAACGGIHLRAALRGHHAVVRRRKRSPHEGDDRCTHERA